MKIAVVGAGPAGSRLARLLADAGHDTCLYDHRSPWEKPCGGGLTTRALDLAGSLPPDFRSQAIGQVCLHYADDSPVTVAVGDALVVVSRKELGQHLLKEAIGAGVRVNGHRVVGLQRTGTRWRVETSISSDSADFIVGADGTSSLVRRTVSRPLSPEDLSVTLGYFIPARPSPTMSIFFVPSVEGYVWSFPRTDHLSYGLITRPGPHWAERGRALLENYIVADLGEQALSQAQFYSASVPRLRPATWGANPLAGDGWALIGDAAGLADPITGEGIYYALRSATILAECFPNTGAYEQIARKECVANLERAANLSSMFYSGRFLGGSFLKRTVQLTRRSPTIQRHMAALISGSVPYHGLRRRLLKSLPSIVWDLMPVPGRAPSN